MASPTLLTCAQVSWFSPRYSVIASIQPPTTACGPLLALVGRWSSFVETVVPSAQTAPIFDMVAPQSVPMNTCLLSSMARSIHGHAADIRAVRYLRLRHCGGSIRRTSLSRRGRETGGRTGIAERRTRSPSCRSPRRRRSGGLELLPRPLDGGDDVRVGAAATEVAAHL